MKISKIDIRFAVEDLLKQGIAVKKKTTGVFIMISQVKEFKKTNLRIPELSLVLLGLGIIGELIYHSELIPFILTFFNIVLGLRYFKHRDWKWFKAISIILAIVIVILLANPAGAQFLLNAENHFINEVVTPSGMTSASTILQVIFGILRGGFIIWLIIQGLHIAKSIQQEEEWQGLVRSPIAFLGIFTLIDLTTTIISGGTGGGEGEGEGEAES